MIVRDNMEEERIKRSFAENMGLQTWQNRLYFTLKWRLMKMIEV